MEKEREKERKRMYLLTLVTINQELRYYFLTDWSTFFIKFYVMGVTIDVIPNINRPRFYAFGPIDYSSISGSVQLTVCFISSAVDRVNKGKFPC